MVEKICTELGLKLPDRDLQFTTRFSGKLGHLRDKTRYAYNRKGEMDYQSHDLTALAARARFSIGTAVLCQRAGLAAFWQPGVGGQYFPSSQDWLYFYFVDAAYANLYDAWNRIANILSNFWPSPNPGEKIYLKQTLERVSKSLSPNPEALKSLLAFKDGEYSRLLNNHRKEIVHTRSTQSSYFERFLREHSNEVVIKELERERDGKPELLIGSYSRLLAGMDETIEVIHAGFPGSSGHTTI